jgi:integrase
VAGFKSESAADFRSEWVADLRRNPHDDSHVFHSVRKTVGTLLENAGVTENVASDILGHEKPRITYGLYSGGASLEVKRAAVE